MDLTPIREQQDRLLDMLALNAAAHVDRGARLALNNIDAEARKYLRRIERHLASPWPGPFGTLGYFGRNGHGPAIADLIRQSELHRCRGAVAPELEAAE